MKTKRSSSQKINTLLKTRLIYLASFVFLGIISGIIFFYLNVGAPKKAHAAVTNISGVVNSYLSATAVNNGSRTFTCTNLSGSIADFAVGNTVMIHQAKGVSIDVTNSSAYGDVTAYNTGGNYEFAVVSSITGTDPYTIIVSTLTNTYSASGLQLISVPIYTDVATTGTVTATPWSSTLGRGGVVAFQATNSLTLGANIDVSGQGFLRGVAGGSDGSCPNSTTYTSTLNNFGAKGEGASSDGQLYARGAQFNGGGGGNPHNAGGGGGGNHTYGGNGGRGYQPGGSCAVLDAGGVGGKIISYASLSNKVFFGGGGGAGQQNDNRASSGANGGGIIVIRAKTITSTCGGTYGILADGASASNSSGNDGAGGGGGGGSIVLDVTSYSLTCNIFIRANGGNGGSVSNNTAHGGGGGGGVGVVMETKPTSDPRVTISSTIGTNGIDCNTCSVTGTPAGTPAYSKIAIGSIPGTVAVLPIKLLYFNGAVVDEGVELSWATAMEENNDFFTLERSFDGVKFDSIITVAGAGNSKKTLTYKTLDRNIFSAKTYYKLKQTDYDRKFTYSTIIFVDTHDLQKTDVSMFPNPASDYLYIINPAAGEKMLIKVLNHRGGIELQQESTQMETRIDVSGFTNGLYIVQTVVNGNKVNQRLVIKH